MIAKHSARCLGLMVMLNLVAIGTSGCGKQLILSRYGSRAGVSRTDQGFVVPRWHPHRGVDVKAYYVGDPVIASHEGKVVRVWFSDEAGWLVTIHHEPSNLYTRYVHLQKPIVKQGERVRRGQKIATVGLFRYSAKVVHVHWMLCTNMSCRGKGPLGGTLDPLEHTIGCFDKTRKYPYRRLVLTMPVPCKNGPDGPELL